MSVSLAREREGEITLMEGHFLIFLIFFFLSPLSNFFYGKWKSVTLPTKPQLGLWHLSRFPPQPPPSFSKYLNLPDKGIPPVGERMWAKSCDVDKSDFFFSFISSVFPQEEIEKSFSAKKGIEEKSPCSSSFLLLFLIACCEKNLGKVMMALWFAFLLFSQEKYRKKKEGRIFPYMTRNNFPPFACV